MNRSEPDFDFRPPSPDFRPPFSHLCLLTSDPGHLRVEVGQSR